MRRLISLISATVALVALAFVLVNATTVDRRPPSVKGITLSAPAGDPRVAQTLTAIDIEFSEPVRPATAEARFRIDPVVDGAFTWNGSTAIFTPTRSLPQATTFTISIAPGVEDLVGNADPAGLRDWTFSTVGPPVVLRSSPADGAVGVPLTGTIELVFDRLMDTASVGAAITVQPTARITAAWSGSILSLKLGPGLSPATTYTVSVGASAADTGGSRLGTPYSTSFTTVGAGLGITAIVPGNGVAGIGVGAPIAIRFDGPIDPASVQGAVHVTPSVDGRVRVVALNGDGSGLDATSAATGGDTLVFDPSSPLAAHTTYTVTLDPTVVRLGDPTAVTVGRTWSFTTGAPTPSGQNQVAFLSARGGVRNVWVMNPDGTNQRELTVELLPVSSFDATADGSRIVYAAGGVVRLAAIDGSSLTRLTARGGNLEYAPVFVPGDATVIVARRDGSGADLGYWLVPLPGASGNERQILATGAPSSGSAALGGDGLDQTGGTPVWDPRIAFDAGGRTAMIVAPTGEVEVVDLGDPALGGGAPLPPVRVAMIGTGQPVWVPARNAFVLSGTPTTGGGSGLISVDTRGRVATIADAAAAIGPVAIAGDGTIAFIVRGLDGSQSLRLLPSQGQVRTVAGPTGLDARWPTFGPNARTLLLGTSLVAQPSVSDGIWKIDLTTGGTRRLTVDGSYPRWIP